MTRSATLRIALFAYVFFVLLAVLFVFLNYWGTRDTSLPILLIVVIGPALVLAYAIAALTASRSKWDWLAWSLLTLGLLAIGVYFTWLFWGDLHSDEDSLSTTIRNLALVIGGIIATVLAIWRSIVAERQADIAQQSSLNERYQRGAEMLGSDVLTVRLGGIYALQGLAEDHSEQYHVQVMRLFSTFVRTSPRQVDAGTEAGETPLASSSRTMNLLTRIVRSSGGGEGVEPTVVESPPAKQARPRCSGCHDSNWKAKQKQNQAGKD